MKNAKQAKHEEMLARAKAGLVLDQPFFASLLLALPFIEDNSIRTMATNGEEIRYNTEFLESMSQAELTFVLAHETMHCVFQHMTRRGDRHPMKWNIAADYIINELLVQEKIGSMPKGGLQDSKLYAKGGGTAEGVYELLPKDSENKKPGDKGGSIDQIYEPSNDTGDGGGVNGSSGEGEGDQDGDGAGQGKPGKAKSGKGKGDAASSSGKGQQPGKSGKGNSDGLIEEHTLDPATKAAKEAAMRVRVVQAKNAARMQGKLSKGIEDLVNELTKTETDWRAILRKFLSERARTEYSFARPKRRFLASDIILPGLTGERLGSLVIAIDCSGSVGQVELEAFSAEIKGIVEDAKPSEVKLVYFHDRVFKTETFGPDDVVEIRTPREGGGTAFSPIFEEVDSYEVPPVAVVVLTDLCCDDFGDVPAYPVLWASTTKHDKVPFGEVTRIKVANS